MTDHIFLLSGFALELAAIAPPFFQADATAQSCFKNARMFTGQAKAVTHSIPPPLWAVLYIMRKERAIELREYHSE